MFRFLIISVNIVDIDDEVKLSIAVVILGIFILVIVTGCKPLMA